jgi:protein TonB
MESSGATGAERIEPLPIEYLKEVSRMIRVNLNYPWQAKRDRVEGTVVVHILLARDGSVVSVSLVQGASNSALDEEACNVVLRIRKFPGLPEDVLRGGREFAIDQPIRFRRA